MKIHVGNFGKVRQADIRLDGITVITGENGSGKSTIGRALVTWCSILRRLDEFVVAERLKSLRDEVNAVFEAHDLPRWSPVLPEPGDVASMRVFEPEFWNDSASIRRGVVLRSRLRQFAGDDELLPERLVNSVLGCKDEILPIVEKLNLRSNDSYYRTIMTDRFRRAFGRAFLSSVVPENDGNVALVSDSAKRRSIAFQGGEAVDIAGIGGNHVPKTFYLEPIHILDSGATLDYDGARNYRMDRMPSPSMYRDWDRYSVGTLGWRYVLAGYREDSDWSLERKQRQQEIEEELDKISETIHGQLSIEDHELKFEDVDLGDTVSIGNIASGAKTMAMIMHGFRHGSMEPGCALIIDEPESNLHPEWQVKFARFLVLLNVRFNTKILLNTHSPFFLKAIRTYSDLFEIGEKCAYYNMEKQYGDKLYTAMQKDEKSIEEVFADMARPYARLIYGENYDSKKLFG